MLENILSCHYLYYFLNRVSETSQMQTFCCTFYIIKANYSREIIYGKYLNVALISSLSSSQMSVKCLYLVKRTLCVISRERNQRLRWILRNFPHRRLVWWISRFHDAVALPNHESTSFSYFSGLVCVYFMYIYVRAQWLCARRKFYMAIKKSRRRKDARPNGIISRWK